MLKPLSYLLLSLLLLPCCKQAADDIQPVPLPAEQPESITEFLRVAQSSSATAAEYISGELDGAYVSCGADKWPSQSSTFYTYTSQNTEHASLSRETPNADVQVTISFTNTGLFQKAMPFAWPHPTPAYCEQIEVEVRKLRPNKEELVLFKGGSSYGIPLQVAITSTANGVVEGTFKGRLNQYVGPKFTGNTFLVKDGKFRIKTNTVVL